MSGSYPQFVQKAGDGSDSEFALTAHQLDGVLDPTVSIRSLVERKSRQYAFINRPYLVWREDPEIARMINDRLAGKTTD